MKKIFVLLCLFQLYSLKGVVTFSSCYPQILDEYITDNAIELKDIVYQTVPKLNFTTNATQNEAVKLDIYYPNINDLSCEEILSTTFNKRSRPMIIFAPGGRMNRDAYKNICIDMARRGFVAVSISVRSTQIPSTIDINQSPYSEKGNHTAAMDLKNAIRFVLSNNTLTVNNIIHNLYINQNYIILGGGSFGGVTSLYTGFVDYNEALQKYGNWVSEPFYSNFNLPINGTIRGICSFYGALDHLDFIDATDQLPTYLYHGTMDPAVPYGTGNKFAFCLNPIVHGSSILAQRQMNLGHSYFLTSVTNMGHSISLNPSDIFPAGFYQNWYPDMLDFIRCSMLIGNSNQTHKIINAPTVNCNAFLPARGINFYCLNFLGVGVFWNTCTNTWVSPSCILQGTPPTNLNNTPIICTNNGSGSARLSNTSPISEVKISNQPFIYPNPTSGKLNINLKLDNVINGYNVSIFSVDGKNIYNNTVNETLEAGTIINNEFDISNQANGIYFIRVTSENNLLLNQKFVLNK